METIPDWTSFRKRIVINKPMSDIYVAWAKPSVLETWFLERADYTDEKDRPVVKDELIEKGNRFSWKWHNWDFTEEGEVLEANGKDKISFTFGPGGVVHVQLFAADNGTEVVLTQDGIPTDEKSNMELFVGCATGWTFWLANLKAWLEHGVTIHATGLSQEETTDLVNS